MENLKSKIDTMDKETLKEVVINLVNRFDDGVDMVFDFCLNALEEVMAEEEFVKFCETL